MNQLWTIEKEIKTAIPFTIASKNEVKYVGILTKEMKDLWSETIRHWWKNDAIDGST